MPKFEKKLLQEYGLPTCGYDGVELVKEEIVDHTRWSVHHEIIFKWLDGKYYRTTYSKGATELQDQTPWEYDKEVECDEVRPVQKMVTVWEDVE